MFSRFASDKSSIVSIIRPRFDIYRKRIGVHHEADRVFPNRFQNRFQNRSNLRVNYHLQFCSLKLVPVNFRRSLLSTYTTFHSLENVFATPGAIVSFFLY
jgi:hypothetical protein